MKKLDLEPVKEIALKHLRETIQEIEDGTLLPASLTIASATLAEPANFEVRHVGYMSPNEIACAVAEWAINENVKERTGSVH